MSAAVDEPGNLDALTLAALAVHRRWVAWQTEDRDGKATKVPYDPVRLTRAKADKPDTWGTRKQAEATASKLRKPYGMGGVGLELGDLGDGRILAGIDLDTCKDRDGTLEPWATDVVERFDSYTETSPSGSGAKVFFLANAADMGTLAPLLSPTGGKKFSKPGSDHPPAIELYMGGRYFAVTGLHLPETPAELRPVALDALLWLLQEAGPVLAGADDSANPAAVGRRKGKDNSHSALALRTGRELRRTGKTYEQMVAAMAADPTLAEWVEGKGRPNNERELRRVWEGRPYRLAERVAGQ